MKIDNHIKLTRLPWSDIFYILQTKHNIHNLEQYFCALYVFYLVSNHFKDYKFIILNNPREQNSLLSKHQEFSDLMKHVDFDYIVKNVQNSSIALDINNAITLIEKIYGGLLKNILRNIDFKYVTQRGYHALKLMIDVVIQHKESIKLSAFDKHQQIIENFEDFLLFFSKYGQFENNTIPFLTTLVANITDIQNGDSVYDPNSGVGTLLIEATKTIDSGTCYLYGQDKLEQNNFISRINMFIHGIKNVTLEHGDTLLEPKILDDYSNLKRFNKIVTILPNSISNWGADLAKYDKHKRFVYGIPPKNFSDYAYLSHMIASLNEYGTITIAIPSGVLFREKMEGQIRQRLLEDNLIDTVISLPILKPLKTNISYAILILKKNRTADEILLVDASNMYEITSLKQRILSKKNIQEIIDYYHERKNIDNISYLADFNEIRINDFNLNPKKYLKSDDCYYIDIESMRDNIDITESKLHIVRNQINKIENDFIHYLKKNTQIN